MSLETQTVDVQYETDQQYACRDCPAKCCRYPWAISVTPEEHQRYMNTPWIQEYLKKAKTHFIQVQGYYKLPRTQRPDGSSACVFLNEDNMCTMQLTDGHEAIPFTCQSYPFGFKSTADGKVWTATSFFCKAILENYGDPMKNVAPEKYESAKTHANEVNPLPPTLTLGGTWNVPQETYLIILDTLESLIDSPHLSVELALWEGNRLLEGLKARYTETQALGKDEVSAYCEQFLAEAGTHPLPEKEARILLSKAICTVGLIYLITEPFNETIHPVFKPFYSLFYNIRQFNLIMNLMLERGKYTLWGMKQPMDMHQAKAVKVNLDSPEAQTLLKRFYKQVFTSKRLFGFRACDLSEHFFRIGASYPYIIRVARYCAASNGRTEAAFEDIREAVGYADLFVYTPPNKLLDRFMNMHTFEGLFDQILFSE